MIDTDEDRKKLLGWLENISNLGSLQGGVDEGSRIELLSQVEQMSWKGQDRAKVVNHLMVQARYLSDIRPWNFEISLSSVMRKAASMAEDTVAFSSVILAFLQPETHSYVKQVGLTALEIMGSGRPVPFSPLAEKRVRALADAFINKELSAITQVCVLGINTIVVLASTGNEGTLDVCSKACIEYKPGTVRLAGNILRMMTINCWRRNSVAEDHPRFRLVLEAERVLDAVGG